MSGVQIFFINFLLGLFSGMTVYVILDIISQFREMKELNKAIEFYNGQIMRQEYIMIEFGFVLVLTLCVYVDGLAVEVKKVVDDNYPFGLIRDSFDCSYLVDDWNAYDVVIAQVRAKRWNGKKNVRLDMEFFYPREKWIKAIKNDWIK